MEQTTAPTTEEIAQNWVTWLKALASGEYEKTTNILHREVDGQERHCCLGVAQICLGLSCTNENSDERLVPLLGFDGNEGNFYKGEMSNCVTYLNDIDHKNDVDFANMHRELLANIELITAHHPEVAPLVRKMLKEQQGLPIDFMFEDNGDLKDEFRRYPTPQKDGPVTRYPDNTLWGTWGTRLDRWQQLNLDRIPDWEKVREHLLKSITDENK